MKMQALPKRLDRRLFLSGINPAVLAAGMMLVSPGLLAAPNAAVPGHNTTPSGMAAPPASDASKEQLIRTLVNLTDVSQLQAVFSQQFIDRVANAVSMFGPALNPHTMDVIQQQTRAVVEEHIQDGDALYSVLAPVYEKHFNIIELNQLVNFYQSPLGQKLVRVSPQLLTESLDLGQQWGLSLVPEIMQRVQSQLDQDAPSAAGTASTSAR
ncbi:MAG: DUF2059 domain-containing protein [Salinisphaera sp.]|jgi:hypothetical protein|nr:DUF2059 domain-containing protein [Salinisphaera sp.]